ncbi:MAG: fluoride efflux transporter CrcB [Gemmataceae bacterium]|nr:fluoride efflux transporter CrcB [Gemmataceae bacterium]
MPDWAMAALTHPAALVAAGGAAGANARYWFGRWTVGAFGDAAFPWATFLVNVSGSAVLGVLAALYLGHPDPARRAWYLLLGTGFCGGFTTFSTFSLETVELLRAGRPGAAAGYVLGSAAAGVLGAWAGLRLCGK